MKLYYYLGADGNGDSVTILKKTDDGDWWFMFVDVLGVLKDGPCRMKPGVSKPYILVTDINDAQGQIDRAISAHQSKMEERCGLWLPSRAYALDHLIESCHLKDGAVLIVNHFRRADDDGYYTLTIMHPDGYYEWHRLDHPPEFPYKKIGVDEARKLVSDSMLKHSEMLKEIVKRFVSA